MIEQGLALANNSLIPTLALSFQGVSHITNKVLTQLNVLDKKAAQRANISNLVGLAVTVAAHALYPAALPIIALTGVLSILIQAAVLAKKAIA